MGGKTVTTHQYTLQVLLGLVPELAKYKVWGASKFKKAVKCGSIAKTFSCVHPSVALLILSLAPQVKKAINCVDNPDNPANPATLQFIVRNIIR